MVSPPPAPVFDSTEPLARSIYHKLRSKVWKSDIGAALMAGVSFGEPLHGGRASDSFAFVPCFPRIRFVPFFVQPRLVQPGDFAPREHLAVSGDR